VAHGIPMVFADSAEPLTGDLPPEYGLLQNGVVVLKTAPPARRGMPVTPDLVWARLEEAARRLAG